MSEAEPIFCLRCGATDVGQFCVCEDPSTFNWLIPSMDLAQLGFPSNWNLIQFQGAVTDTI